MMAFRTFLTFLLIAAIANAFVPVAHPRLTCSKTQVQFGFLKDLGLEKPSWLPDFGGNKKEEAETTTNDAPTATVAVDGDAPAAAEGDAAPKDDDE